MSNAVKITSLYRESTERRIPLASLTSFLDGTWVGSPPREVHSVQIDSKDCEEGSLFVGLSGQHTHGQQFLEDAVEHGAIAAIVEEKQDVNCPQFVTKSSERTLQDLSSIYRAKYIRGYVVGITGSCGKTTVKEMISSVLGRKYEVGKTQGNYNNHIGLPLTILNEGYREVLVAEVGINKPGEMEQLASWLQPHMTVITHIGPAHLEKLGTVENLAREKAKLIQMLPEDGISVIPGWVEHRHTLTESSPTKPRIVRPDDSFDAKGIQSIRDIITGLFDREVLRKDAVIAASVGEALGVSAVEVRRGLSEFSTVEGRGRTVQVESTTIIDGSYNANPDSMVQALSRLQDMEGPRLAVLGDMKELGKNAEKWHKRVGEKLNDLPDTDVVYCGDYGEAVLEGIDNEDRIGIYDNVEDVEELDWQQYETVLVKASHSIGLHRLIDQWLNNP
ncbi:MAG: UDP-N-acetylmuramoyl-tripeptide--D-alanyl-D-alanine ligase [bacterium]